MKTKKKILFALIPIFFIFVFSCKNQREKSVDSYEKTSVEFKRFIEEPDSVFTKDEILKRNKLYNLIFENIYIYDNLFYSTATPENFTENELSKFYYDILEKSITEANQWVKEEGISNLDSMLQSSKNFILKMK